MINIYSLLGDLLLFSSREWKSRMNTSDKNVCAFLVFWEKYEQASEAVNREGIIRNYSRKRKTALVSSFNPGWDFLNSRLYEDAL